MIRERSHLAILLLFLLLAQNTTARSVRDTLHTGGRMEFVENRGQWDGRVLFASQMHDAALFLEQGCFTIVVRESAHHTGLMHHTVGERKHAYKMHFTGANASHKVTGGDLKTTYSNYYRGKDPSRWQSHVAHYSEVAYSNLYDGIDLRVYSAKHALKYDFVVQPRANAEAIRLEYEGTEGLRLRGDDLLVRTSVNEVVEMKPYAYQESYEGAKEVECHYHIEGNRVSFEVGDYDTTQPLIIDPTLVFSTYSGSEADNWGTTATYDSYKNAYMAGVVFEIGYPTSMGAYDTVFHGESNDICDVGIFKLDPTGSQRLFATYLGGVNCDMPHSMYVNTFDELLILGTTGSADFPTTAGSYDTSFNGGTALNYLGTSIMSYPNGSDLFISRFSSDGTQLMASTFVGGSDNDGLNYRASYNSSYMTMYAGNGGLYNNYGDGVRGELITDDINNIYVGSTTFSSDFPVTEGCLQPSLGGSQDGVVFKIDHNLKNLLWSTYLGSPTDDAVYSIDTDKDYNVVVCGGTASGFFPVTTGCYQSVYGGGTADGFVSKISYHGDRLMGSTYVGSDAYDQLYFVRCGKDDDIFVYGQTKATGSTWIYNANYNTPNSGMLLARLSGDLQGRIWSTVFGTGNGSPNLSPTAFCVDNCNRIYAVGWGRDFVPVMAQFHQAGTYNMSTTSDAYQDTTDGQDFYIMSLDAQASQLRYASFMGELAQPNSNYYGRDHVDGGTSRFDRLGTLYQSVCAGCAGSDNFPTTVGAWSDSNGSSNCNNALFRLNVSSDFPVAEFVTPPAGCAPYTVNFHNTGRGSSYLWVFGDGDTSTAFEPVHTFDSAGTYSIRLVAYMPGGCCSSDTMEVILRVLGNGNSITSQMSCAGDPVQIGFKPLLGCNYHWIAGNVSDSTVANPYVEETGIYVLQMVADQGGCVETDTFNVSFIRLVDTLLLTHPRCPGESSGKACVITTGIHDNLTYSWDGVITHDSCREGLSSGEHTLFVIDSLCSVEMHFTLSNPPLPQLQKATTPIICHDCEGSIAVRASDSRNMPFSYLWDDSSSDTLRTGLCGGTYQLTYSDTNGCTYRDTTIIEVSHLLDGLRTWSDDTVIFAGLSTQLHCTTIPGATYQWTPTTGLSNHRSNNTTAKPQESTQYSVIVTDSNGCSDTLSLYIRCIQVTCGEEELFIPNVFTPNGDGKNDQLCFRNRYLTEFQFALYNRWGEQVFETDDVNHCWDGRYKESDCPAGVYMYTCRYRCVTGEENEIKGDITLIR